MWDDGTVLEDCAACGNEGCWRCDYTGRLEWPLEPIDEEDLFPEEDA